MSGIKHSSHIGKQGQAISIYIETVSPEGTFCDTVQVPSSAGDIELN